MVTKVNHPSVNLASVFPGRDDCHGIYHIDTELTPGTNKRKGRALTYPNERFPKKGKVSHEEYLGHELGTFALGIVPVLPDGNAYWGAIDVDDYTLNHTELSKKIDAIQLPVIHCRSKSGGAHLYIRSTELVPAKLIIDAAKKIAERLGISRPEIFPKQAKFDAPEAIGNWIILPYFRGEKAEDYAIDGQGKKVDYQDFVNFAQSRYATPDEIKAIINGKIAKEWSEDQILEQQPPCIRAMMHNTVREGEGRNNAMSHLCWNFRLIDEQLDTSDWQEKLEEFNGQYFDPPLSFREFAQIVKNHSKGKYGPRCSQQPMASLCNRDECLKLKFGIGRSNAYGEIAITSVTKLETGDDPVWIFYIDGNPVHMDSATALNPRLFRIKILSTLNKIIPPLKQSAHDELITPPINDALIIEQAELVSTGGKAMDCWRTWILNNVDKAHGIEKLYDGLPYYSNASKKIYFRLVDFMSEYKRVYKEPVADAKMYVTLKSLGFEYQKYQSGSHNFTCMVYLTSPNDESWITLEKLGGKAW